MLSLPLCSRKRTAAPQKQDILDPLWTSNSQHEYRMAAMWATLRQLRLACTGLLAHLDQLNARYFGCLAGWSIFHSVRNLPPAPTTPEATATPKGAVLIEGVQHMRDCSGRAQAD